MIKFDGVLMKSPSDFTWGLQDVSAADSGRTDDAKMHKNRVAQKRKLSLSWNGPTPQEASTILKAANPEYIEVTYPDPMSGEDETRTFYTGDKTAPFKVWSVSNKRYSLLSFDFIEQ